MTHNSLFNTDIEALASPDKNVRLRAVMSLGQAAHASAIPALLTRLREETVFFVRDNTSWAIARCGCAATEPLITMLGDPDAGVRYHAVHALSKLGDARAVDAVIALLDDPDHEVAKKSIFALGRIRDARILPLLAAHIGNGALDIRITRNEALHAFGAEAVPHVAAMLSHADTVVRVEAAEILGTIGDDTALAALADVLSDAAWEVRFAALNAMRGATNASASSAIRAAASDVHPHVRLLAERLLKEL